MPCTPPRWRLRAGAVSLASIAAPQCALADELPLRLAEARIAPVRRDLPPGPQGVPESPHVLSTLEVGADAATIGLAREDGSWAATVAFDLAP